MLRHTFPYMLVLLLLLAGLVFKDAQRLAHPVVAGNSPAIASAAEVAAIVDGGQEKWAAAEKAREELDEVARPLLLGESEDSGEKKKTDLTKSIHSHSYLAKKSQTLVRVAALKARNEAVPEEEQNAVKKIGSFDGLLSRLDILNKKEQELTKLAETYRTKQQGRREDLLEKIESYKTEFSDFTPKGFSERFVAYLDMADRERLEPQAMGLVRNYFTSGKAAPQRDCAELVRHLEEYKEKHGHLGGGRPFSSDRPDTWVDKRLIYWKYATKMLKGTMEAGKSSQKLAHLKEMRQEALKNSEFEEFAKGIPTLARLLIKDEIPKSLSNGGKVLVRMRNNNAVPKEPVERTKVRIQVTAGGEQIWQTLKGDGEEEFQPQNNIKDVQYDNTYMHSEIWPTRQAEAARNYRLLLQTLQATEDPLKWGQSVKAFLSNLAEVDIQSLPEVKDLVLKLRTIQEWLEQYSDLLTP